MHDRLQRLRRIFLEGEGQGEGEGMQVAFYRELARNGCQMQMRSRAQRLQLACNVSATRCLGVGFT